MVRQSSAQVDAELKKDELNVDGSGAISGSAPVPGEGQDTEEMIKEAFGNKPNDPDGFDIASEVENDEKEIQHGSDESIDLENSEEKEHLDKNDQIEQVDDPYIALGEDDLDTSEE